MRLATLILGDTTSNRVVPAAGFTAFLTIASAAAMAFLAVFAIALASAADDLAARWEAEFQGTATVRVTAPEGGMEEAVERALLVLQETPGVASVRRMDLRQQQELLAPWFGPDLPLDALRLPVMIDVLEEGAGPDLEGLRNRLAGEAPGTVYDSHDRWRAPLIDAAERLRRLAIAALVLILGVAGTTVALAASASMSANAQVIDVLKLVGARHRWIARAFMRRFTLRATLGAIAGSLAAALVLALMPAGIETGVLSGLGLSGSEWLWPVVVPVASGLIAWIATYLAAFRRLRGG